MLRTQRIFKNNGHTSIVLPFPGGPNNNIPFVGALKPVKSSGFKAGKIMVSSRACLADSFPITLSNRILVESTIHPSISCSA